MPISSLIVSSKKGQEGPVRAFIEDIECYEILKEKDSSFAVLSDTVSLSDEYAMAQRLASNPDIREIKIVFHHLDED